MDSEAEAGIYREPILLYRAGAIRKRIYESLGDLEARACVDSEPIPFEERTTRPSTVFKSGRSWGGPFSCAWFNLRGRVPAAGRGRHVVAIVDLGGEGLLVDARNEALRGLSNKVAWVDRVQSTRGKGLIEVAPVSTGGESIDLWIEAGYNGTRIGPFGRSRFRHAYLAVCRDDIKAFYYDFLVLAFAVAALRGRPGKAELAAVLGRAWAAARPWTESATAAARAILAPELDRAEETVLPAFTAIGHSHLDLAWLWPLRETRRKAARTFSTALANIEAFPGYVYGASQPQQFDWIRGERPLLYARIKDAVRAGSFELQGGMWVEADTNLPSGESLLRQILYGKAFFGREFGEEMRICWLPDVFGYNANLPQILAKTGLEYFMTIKLSWNEHNDFPHRSFNWEGIDGSTVLVHMAPEGDYNSGGTPLCVGRAVARYPEKLSAGEGLLVYGVGDGGGGPGEVHIELLRRQGGIAGLPRVGFGKAVDFFDRLAMKARDLPTYRGELYLEKHQGTYTTQGRSKAANRRMEALLHEIEFLATRAWLGGADYPAVLLERVWKEVLLYQFHDILPGSSIGRVYAESLARYAALEAELGAERARLLALSPADAPRLVNTSPFPRVDFCKLGDTWYRARAEAYASAPLEAARPPFGLAYGEDGDGGGWIQNEALRAHFTRDGWLDSLMDRRKGQESSGGFLNRLVIYTDTWKFFNAWDIDWKYPRKRRVTLKAHATETFLDGPRVVRRSSYRHGRSLLVQEAILVSGGEILEFDTACDWHETFRMLRADFRPAVWSDRVTCDIQFGSFQRSTRDDSPEERAQFEICAHKWIDLSEGGRGLSLINDCKYGHRVKQGIMSLGLLRSPVFPDPKADRGNHRFRYALYPHEGGALESGVVEKAWIFNAPRLVAEAGTGEGAFARATTEGIVVETVKKAEEGDLVVLRLVECAGRAATTSLELSFAWSQAYEADMLERATGPADLAALSFTPFEVKTILVRP